MLNFLTQLIPTLVILGFLIFVHEFGHYLACIWSRVRVEKFSIGFGPEVFRWVRKGTVYAISAIPLGGFVKPAGESFGELAGNAPKPGDFLAASPLRRFGILIAGVFMNYVFAVFLLAIVFWMGHPVLKAKIGGFVKGFPAETSGLQVGDEVTKLNGTPIQNWQQMTLAIIENQAPELRLDVNRGDEILEIVIVPRTEDGANAAGEKQKISRIGITPTKEYFIEKFPLWGAIKNAIATTVNLTILTYKSLWYLVTGKLSVKALSGPIGIMVMAGNAAQLGLATLLQFTALISISLAVINLLPIPALDGGHIFFLLLGVIFRREINPKIQDRMTQVGFALLMALMVFVVYNDLINVGVITKIKSFFGH
ncbi:MAG: RIP metalloprotease RseP [Candidatus Omnitrophica bacterium]|nr:RIP metalloprotease RseP [Candidatus Omnitrophota bacterium]